MKRELDFSKHKVSASYKTIYIRNETIEKINQIAIANNTSFNNVIVSMINYCIDNNLNTK